MSIEKIAELVHEANRAICQAQGDDTQPPWADAPEWQRKASTEQVLTVVGSPDITPEGQHETWMAGKIADGWTFGAVKDPDAKTHPCLVPYTDLPFEQKVKDYVFNAIVKTAIKQSA